MFSTKVTYTTRHLLTRYVPTDIFTTRQLLTKCWHPKRLRTKTCTNAQGLQYIKKIAWYLCLTGSDRSIDRHQHPMVFYFLCLAVQTRSSLLLTTAGPAKTNRHIHVRTHAEKAFVRLFCIDTGTGGLAAYLPSMGIYCILYCTYCLYSIWCMRG